MMSNISNISCYNSVYGTHNASMRKYNKEQSTEKPKEAIPIEEKVKDSIDDLILISQSSNKVQADNYSNLGEYISYLMENYENLKTGAVTISKSYLRECFNDEEKRTQLEKALSDAEVLIKDSEANTEGYIGMKVEINADGKVETETYSGVVIFNEGKRAAQIAAATTSTDLSMIMDILSKDLSDCKNGLQNGFCDESEVNKVNAMIQKAQAKQQGITAQERRSKEKGGDTPNNLTINLLM